MPGADRIRDVERALGARKRGVYQAGIVVAVAVTMGSWLTREPGDAILTYGYPLFAVVLLSFLPLLRRERVPLVRIELGLFLSAAALVLVRLGWHLFGTRTLEEQLLVLTGGHYWAFGLLMIFGFVMFDRRLGLRMGSALLLVSLALAGAAMGAAATEGTLEARTVVYLLRVHGFLALMLMLVAGVASLREQLHRALERSEVLSSRAMTDPLTGLGNRWAAEERLAEEIEDASRRDRSVAVVMVDVDDFKAINDHHGHSTGDAVLAAIAALIDDEVRGRDLVARWGGEEFLVVLPEVGADEAARAAERCRVAVAEGAPGGVAATATFGVAGLADGEGAGALLRRADLALYEGKRLGRDRVVIAETPASPPSGAEATHHGPASVAPATRERGDERTG